MKDTISWLKSKLLNIDYHLFAYSSAVSIIGLIFIASATHSYQSDRYIIIQAAGIIIGIIGMIIIAHIDYEHLSELSKYIFIACVLLLILVLFIGTGGEETGNKSWIRLNFLSIGIQPSELVKIGFAITFATHLAIVKDNINSPKNVMFLLAHFGIIFSLVLIQGDLGSALVFLFMAACMCFAAKLSLWYFAGAGVASVAALPFIWEYVLKSYQRNRILVVLYPELDPMGYGYQATQCKTAIGSGQLLGNGLYHGTLTQYELLPAKHTDCIFAAIGEEGGLICCLIVVFLLTALIIRCFAISKMARNDTGALICVGIGSMLLFQTFENIGMCLGILPVIGITLPLVSYGGSSVVTVFWALGLCMSVYLRRKVINF